MNVILKHTLESIKQTSTIALGAFVPKNTFDTMFNNVVQIQVPIKAFTKKSQLFLKKYNESKINEFHVIDDSIRNLYEKKH